MVASGIVFSSALASVPKSFASLAFIIAICFARGESVSVVVVSVWVQLANVIAMASIGVI